MSNITKEATRRAKNATEDFSSTLNPIKAASDLGVRSEYAYIGGFASILLSLVSWIVSRGKKDDKAQSDRWGIFIGHWAPTFFALGLALKLEERDRERGE